MGNSWGIIRKPHHKIFFTFLEVFSKLITSLEFYFKTGNYIRLVNNYVGLNKVGLCKPVLTRIVNTFNPNVF